MKIKKLISYQENKIKKTNKVLEELKFLETKCPNISYNKYDNSYWKYILKDKDFLSDNYHCRIMLDDLCRIFIINYIEIKRLLPNGKIKTYKISKYSTLKPIVYIGHKWVGNKYNKTVIFSKKLFNIFKGNNLKLKNKLKKLIIKLIDFQIKSNIPAATADRENHLIISDKYQPKEIKTYLAFM